MAAMVVNDMCPGCGSIQFKKNGHIHSGKQNHQCKACGRQFVASAEERLISDERRTLVEHLLRERISLRGLCRAVGVSLTWLLHFMVDCFATCPDHLHVKLSTNIPELYQQRAMFHTDQYDVYTGVIPAGRRKAITKQARKTNHIERFNNTLRQRLSRLVRATLSFSKKVENHIGAIKFFICHYNLEKAAALPVLALPTPASCVLRLPSMG